MNICIVTPNAEKYSGIGRIAWQVGASLRKKGHIVGLVTERGSTEYETLYIQFNSRNPLIMLRSIIRTLVFMHRYDVVLCYDILPAGFLVALCTKLLRKPLYIHCVGTYSLFSKSLIKNFFMKAVYSSANKIFVLSNAVKQHIEKSLDGYKLDKYMIIPPGVQVDFFRPVAEVSLLVREPYIITVGAVKSRKGHDISLRAFAKLAKKYPDLTYVIVGKFDQANEFSKVLQEIINNENLKNRVVFLGDIEDSELRKLYSHAKFFIMVSRTTDEFIEGFGIVYLEAALCGLTSIGAKKTGAEDAICNGITGILTELNPEAVTDAMLTLLNSQELADRYAAAAQKYAKSFSWDAISERYINEILNDKIK